MSCLAGNTARSSACIDTGARHTSSAAGHFSILLAGGADWPPITITVRSLLLQAPPAWFSG
jgi:hypothetical protein